MRRSGAVHFLSRARARGRVEASINTGDQREVPKNRTACAASATSGTASERHGPENGAIPSCQRLVLHHATVPQGWEFFSPGTHGIHVQTSR